MSSSTLRALVEARLDADATLDPGAGLLVLAALDGSDALAAALADKAAAEKVAEKAAEKAEKKEKPEPAHVGSRTSP